MPYYKQYRADDVSAVEALKPCVAETREKPGVIPLSGIAIRYDYGFDTHAVCVPVATVPYGNEEIVQADESWPAIFS